MPTVARDHAASPVNSLGSISELEQCKHSIAASTLPDQPGMDIHAIDLLNWNIKKGSEANWATELTQYSNEKELVLIQEAVQTMNVQLNQGKSVYKSFAPGYKNSALTSGVATYSNIAPIHQCHMTAYEPWLGTPKATNITRYALEDSDKTLMVVNIHMINFSLGQKPFRAQLIAMSELVSAHLGPIIISGDFNTWRPLRRKILEQEMARMGLEPVSFPDDRRSRFFGQPLDHIYTGNLSVREATAHETESSDHNPMTIRLELRI